MTATSPHAANGSQPSWRARWAERENDRRRRAHAGDAEAWRRRADELTRLRVEVTGLLGATSPPAAPAPVKLRHGEVVQRVLPAAELVEVVARHAAELPAPGLAVDPDGTDAPARPLPRGIRAVDTGRVVVTGRRVVFLGRHRQRIWWYEDLVGPAHHPRAPLTLLPTTDGSPPAGLLVPRPATLTFRFHLTLAFADGLGNRDAVAACLDELVAAHQRARPAAPPVAAPAHAPATARLHDRRLAAAAAAVAASLVAVATVTTGPALSPTIPLGRPSPIEVSDENRPSGGSPNTGTAPAAPLPAPHSATPSAAAPPPPVAPAPGSAASATPGSPEVVPQPIPSVPPLLPSPVDLCGAPANPYGYTYCGGLLIHEPAADVCQWFRCVAEFGRGKGFLVRCDDGLVGWVGGPGGTCAEHRGQKGPVYRPLVPDPSRGHSGLWQTASTLLPPGSRTNAPK